MPAGVAPAETRQGIEMFKKTGVLGKSRERARSKLGLEPVQGAGTDDLKRLLRDTWRAEE